MANYFRVRVDCRVDGDYFSIARRTDGNAHDAAMCFAECVAGLPIPIETVAGERCTPMGLEVAEQILAWSPDAVRFFTGDEAIESIAEDLAQIVESLSDPNLELFDSACGRVRNALVKLAQWKRSRALND